MYVIITAVHGPGPGFKTDSLKQVGPKNNQTKSIHGDRIMSVRVQIFKYSTSLNRHIRACLERWLSHKCHFILVRS